MQRDVYLQSHRTTPSTPLTCREKAIGVAGMAVLLIAIVGAGALLLFDFALPVLGRAWRAIRPDEQLALTEACTAYAAVGAVLLFGWIGAKRLRNVVMMAVAAAIIMPAFALGYLQVSNVWRTLFRLVLSW